jgi:hypothetical protein
MKLYAKPSKLFVRQVVGDIGFVLVTVAAYFLARGVYWLIDLFAGPPRQLASTADGLSDTLAAAADTAGSVPLLGDTIREPFDSLSGGLTSIEQYAEQMVRLVDTTALVVAIIVFAIPVIWWIVKWLPDRVRFVLQSIRSRRVLSADGGIELFALRALATAPLHELTKVTPDPVKAWKEGDTEKMRRLAEVALAADGLPLPDPVKKKKKSRRKAVEQKPDLR